MVRFYTPNLDEACDALNLYDIDYDLDDGDRIMVDDSFYDDVLDAFEEYDIPKKPCPFCGAFLENEAPSTIWCHPRNSCLLSLRGIVGADQIVQWDTRYGEMTGKDNAIGEE